MALTFAESHDVQSWGRLTSPRHTVARPRFAEDLKAPRIVGPRVISGARRSYGDVGLLADAHLIDLRGLDRFITFDEQTGLLRAQAGVTLDAMLSTFVPRGFFPPVTPGTKFVTLGGAIANDVHGKNHRTAGTFGCHVEAVTLARSDGEVLSLTPSNNAALFAATIGGMGLTGTIIDATIRLQRIRSAHLDVETVIAKDLEQLCEVLAACGDRHEHAVAWIDCTSAVGRGVVSAADWSETGTLEAHQPSSRLAFPTDRLGGLLNSWSLRAFNTAYFRRQQARPHHARSHFDRFFYPLDRIACWNRLYGQNGFYQYQVLVPAAAGIQPLQCLLREIAAAQDGSFLAVLKNFGSRPSPGLMSFPAPGLTLALDFRNRGERTLALLRRLDAISMEAGGRLYPAKDAHMSPEMFVAGYPQLARFKELVDPNHQSDFWKRVTA